MGIRIEDELFELNEEGFVSFSEKNRGLIEKKSEIYLICGDFAQKIENIQLGQVNYNFTCEISTSEESFQKGEKGKFLFQPRLFVND